jgi:c-di-GMP-binding flagellar brake protein YcgR
MEKVLPGPAATDARPAAGVEARAYKFEDMRLMVGDALQLSPPSHVGSNRCKVRLIGYVLDKTLMVEAPPSGQWPASLKEGDPVTISVFNGQAAFGFSVHVDKIIRQPLDYLHLSFPKEIIGKIVRTSRRIQTEFAVTTAGHPNAAVISNLSIGGAEVRATGNPGELGATIGLSFVLKTSGVETALSLQAVIRSLKQDRDGAEGAVRCGVQFQNLQPNDVTALQSVVLQELVGRTQDFT